MAAQWVHAPQLPLPVGRLQPPPQPYASIGVDAYGPQMDLQALLSLLALMQGNQRSKDELTFNRERLAAEQGFQAQTTQHQQKLLEEQIRQAKAMEKLQEDQFGLARQSFKDELTFNRERLAAEQGFQTQTKQHQEAMLAEQRRQAEASEKLQEDQFGLARQSFDVQTEAAKSQELMTRLGAYRDRRVTEAAQTVKPQIRAQVTREVNAGKSLLAAEVSEANRWVQSMKVNPQNAGYGFLRAVNNTIDKLQKLDGKFSSAAQASGAASQVIWLQNVMTRPDVQATLSGDPSYNAALSKLSTLAELPMTHPPEMAESIMESLLGEYQQKLAAQIGNQGAAAVDEYYRRVGDVGVKQASTEVLGNLGSRLDGIQVALPLVSSIPARSFRFGPMADTSEPGVFESWGRSLSETGRSIKRAVGGYQEPTGEDLRQQTEMTSVLMPMLPNPYGLQPVPINNRDFTAPLREQMTNDMMGPPEPLWLEEFLNPWVPR